MKKLFIFLTMLVVGIVSSWADDYSDSYYYISTSTQSHYGFYSAASGNRLTTYGSTSAKTSAVIFKFIKTGADDEYYWYNCTDKKYISVDGNGNLLSADTNGETDAYKWYIISKDDGTVTITDKNHYNSGDPTIALVTLGGNGSWWGVNDLSNQSYTNKSWKLIPAVEMKKSYYIGLGRGGNRYLQYDSSDNKMKQVVAETKDLSHVWYFTDEGNGVINIHPITTSSAMGYASDASAGADKISTTNSVKDFKVLISSSTYYPIGFLTNAGSNTLYISNNGGVDYPNMGLYSNIDDPGTRMSVEVANVNAYIGANKTISTSEWQTEGNWSLCDNWNSQGPGVQSTNMWSHIYLKDITGGTIPTLEGWNFRMTADHSTYTINNVTKIQGGQATFLTLKNTSNVTLNFNDGNTQHTFPLTVNLDEGTNNILTFNASNGFKHQNCGDENCTGQITVNYGSITKNTSREFRASGSGNINTLVLNATITEPTENNTVESITLATLTGVSANTLTTNISGTEEWTSVGSKAALETQITDGLYYYVEKGNSTGVKLHIYHRFTTHDVPESTTETLSEISGYNTFSYINVPSGSTLIVDVDFNLAKISGAGDVVLDADVTFSGNKSTVATGKLTINEGKTLTIGSGQGQTNSIESFSSIELAGMIKHQNSKATLNNVTVPTGKTGAIYAYYMGNEADGFRLTGTTTLTGNLVVCSKNNFQMKVDALAGSGQLSISGFTKDDLSDAGNVASAEAATINVAGATAYTGPVYLNNANATLNLAGSLVGSTWTKINGTLNYTGNNLNGTTLDGVVLNSTTARITTSNTVNIKNLAGCNLPNPSGNYGYAFVGSGTINLYGTCDFTKKANGTTALSSNLGYGSSASIVIKENATVTAGVVYNTNGTTNNNASITVESGATLNTIGWTHADDVLYATNLTNNGTINLSTGQFHSGYGLSKIHNTLSGSGELNIAEGANLEVASVPSTITLSGSGNVKLTAFPTSTAPTLENWTGAITFPDNNTKQASIDNIFNAWGNENSTINLNNANGYFSAGATVNPTLNILSGKTFTINDGYSGSTNPTIKKLTGDGTFSLTFSPNKDFQININTLANFNNGTLNSSSKPIVVNKLVVSSDPPFAGALLIKTSGSGTVTLNNLYIGLERTTAYTWETKTVEEVTGIYVATFNEVQLRREMAVATVSPYYNHIGTGVGKYTISLGIDKKYTSISEFETAILAWADVKDCSLANVTINQPTSAFYRIKSGDKYLQDARKSDSDTQRTLTDAAGANESAETIFYLDNNKFIGYKTGYGFGYSVCQTQDTEQLNTQLFTESAEMGKYTIQSQQGTCTSADDNVGYWGINDSDLSREADAASGACWTLEPVTSVPVTFNSAAMGYATFNCPVALKVPAGVEAYVCKLDIDKNTIKLYQADQIKDGDDCVLPAETPVLLYNNDFGTDDTKLFTVASATDKYEHNGFIGTVAAETPDYGKYLYYALRKKSSSMGFYQRSDQTAALTGFRAWIAVPKTSGARNFTIEFDGDSDPTGIVEALGLENDNVEIYDLNGRKLSSYQNGINIVNGKKVFK